MSKFNISIFTKLSKQGFDDAANSASRATTRFSILTKQNKKVSDSFSNLTHDAHRVNKSFRLVGSSASNLGGIIKGLGAYKIANTLARATQANIDMVESINLFNVAMGEYAEVTNKALENTEKFTGLDLTNLQNRAGTFNLLARSMGIADNQAAKLSENMTRLSIDLASLTNVSVNQAAQDLRSGLVGQSETMYKYGVDVTEAALKQEALNQGITKSVRQMSQGEKMALRYAVTIRQTALSHGDFARNIETPANQLKILSERFVTLTRTIGSVFIPMLTKVLPYINAIVIVLTRLFATLAAFFGYKPAETVKNTKNGFSAIKVGADDASKSIGKANKGIKDTTKNMKKLKQSLSGLDEINIIGSKDTPKTPSSSGKGVGDGGGSPFDVDLPEYDSMFDSVKDRATELADIIQPKLVAILKLVGLIGIALLTWKIISFISSLKTTTILFAEIYTMVKRIGLMPTLKGFFPEIATFVGVLSVLGGIYLMFKGIKGILEESEITWQNYAKAIGGVILVAGGLYLLFGGIPALIGLVSGIIGVTGVSMYKNVEWFRDGVNDSWDKIKEVSSKLAEYISGAFHKAWENLGKLIQWFSKNVINPIGKLLSWLWKDVLVPLGRVVGDVLVTAFNGLKNVAEALWKNIMKPFGDFIKGTFQKVIEGLIEIFNHWWKKTMQPLGDYLSRNFGVKIEGLIDVMEFLWKNVLKPISTFMGGVFISVFKSVTNSIGEYIGHMKKAYSGLIDFIVGIFTGNWKKAWNGIKTFFQNTFKGAISLVTGLFNTFMSKITNMFSTKNWSNIMSGIGGVFTRVFKNATNGAIGLFNQFIGWINSKMKFSWDGLTIAGKEIYSGGSVQLLKIPKIPRLAKGGITDVNNPFMAIVGDNTSQREVVSPLDDLLGMIQQTVNASGGNGDITLVVQLGDETIMDKVIRTINRDSMINGKSVIRV